METIQWHSIKFYLYQKAKGQSRTQKKKRVLSETLSNFPFKERKKTEK